VAAQSGRVDLVRYLLAKGANPAIADSQGRKPIDLVGAPPPAGAAAPTAGRGAGRGDAQASAASVAEIRDLLQNAVSRR
jgi:hypothetical protein